MQKYIRDRGGVVLSSVRQIAAGLRGAWEKKEVVTHTESQKPADREKEEGSASDGQAEDDEETEDNVYWATSRAMVALKPDKTAAHLTAFAGPGVAGVQHGSHGLLCPARQRAPMFRSHVCQVPKCTKGHEVRR